MTAFKLIVLKEIKKFLVLNAKRNISISHNHQQSSASSLWPKCRFALELAAPVRGAGGWPAGRPVRNHPFWLFCSLCLELENIIVVDVASLLKFYCNRKRRSLPLIN